MAGVVAVLSFALLAATASAPPRHIVWTQGVADLESLAGAALPVRFDIGGGWTGLSLVVEKASRFKASAGRLQLHLQGHTEPLAVVVETDVSLRLRFDSQKGVHVVELESMPLRLGALGRIDLARTLGPWEIGPDQLHTLSLKGSAGLGVKTTIRALDLSEDGLRAEVDVHYFRPLAE
jgi:hypothetical protein